MSDPSKKGEPKTIGDLDREEGDLDGSELLEIEKDGLSKSLAIKKILALIDASGLTIEQLALLNSVKNKVDKVQGMNLSSNNFTDILRSKLVDIEPNATKNSKDSFLLDRSKHHGTQPIGSIDGLTTFLNSINNALSGKVSGTGVNNIVSLTQLEYDGLFEDKDPRTLYVIVPYTHGR